MSDLVTLQAGSELKFRDSTRAHALAQTLERLCTETGRSPISLMHVCGSHEQAIAKFGLRAVLPRALDVIMGPGCPVCVTDLPEVDEAVVLAQDGVRIATYGDMLKVPGSAYSLADVLGAGARVDVVYSATQAVELARDTSEEVVFFASGFETTAVATAAVILDDPPRISPFSLPTSTSRRSWRSLRRCPARASRAFSPPATRPRSQGGQSSSDSSSDIRSPSS